MEIGDNSLWFYQKNEKQTIIDKLNYGYHDLKFNRCWKTYGNLRLSRFAAVKNLNIGKDIWISNQTLPFILSHFSSSRSRDYPHHMLNRHLSTGGRHFYLLAQILQPTSQSKREVQVRRLK